MHRLTINVKDNVVEKVVYFLKNLPVNDVELISEELIEDKNDNVIDFSKYNLSVFKNIENPVEWQREIRNEWEN